MHEPRYFGRVVNMGQAEFSLCRSAYSALFERALRRAAEENFDLLVLDEAVSACNHGAIDEKQLLGFLKARPAGLEVVLTGRDPSQALLEAADYVTEMKKFKHPFESGIARTPRHRVLNGNLQYIRQISEKKAKIFYRIIDFVSDL